MGETGATLPRDGHSIQLRSCGAAPGCVDLAYPTPPPHGRGAVPFFRPLRSMAIVHIALGSNLGDRLAHLQAGARAIAAATSGVVASSVYETPPMYRTDQPSFLNAVLRCVLEGDPAAWMARLHAIEEAHGRARTVPNGPRTLDLDLLDWQGVVQANRVPELPHPRLTERPFVVFPLLEVSPDWVHPISGASIRDLAGTLQAPPIIAPPEAWGAFTARRPGDSHPVSAR